MKINVVYVKKYWCIAFNSKFIQSHEESAILCRQYVTKEYIVLKVRYRSHLNRYNYRDLLMCVLMFNAALFGTAVERKKSPTRLAKRLMHHVTNLIITEKIYLFNVYLYRDKYIAWTDATHQSVYSLIILIMLVSQVVFFNVSWLTGCFVLSSV